MGKNKKEQWLLEAERKAAQTGKEYCTAMKVFYIHYNSRHIPLDTCQNNRAFNIKNETWCNPWTYKE